MKKNPDWPPVLLSIWKVIQKILDKLKEFGERYPSINQNIQFTVMYYFAFIDLTYSILSGVYALGDDLSLLRPFFPFIKWVFESPTVEFWLSPERSFIVTTFILETVVERGMFGLSTLVRFNIVMLFSLLMLQALIISYWDAIFNKETVNLDVLLYNEPDEGDIIDEVSGVPVFYLTFFVFFFIYVALYISAIRGKFFTAPGFTWITDSACFWLKIRTPTMFNRKGKKNPPKDKRKG
jgi:hypothetical protein